MKRALVPVATLVLASGSAVASTATASAVAGAGYSTYVACSNKASGKPSHECRLSQPKAAYFVSTRHDATYKVCVRFPGKKKRLCASAQPAPQGKKTLVTIATASTGTHQVTWYVDGKKVGTWNLQVTEG